MPEYSSDDITFYFVVDGLGLEVKSVFLCSTLREHHPAASLIAYVSTKSIDTLNSVTRHIYDTLKVEIRPLPEARAIWQKSYPHGNKLLAAADKRETAVSVFLDTDMICVRPLSLSDLPMPGEVCVIPEGVPTWGKKDNRWIRAYKYFGLEFPKDTVRLTRRRRREFVPYFNAGFVAFRENDLVDGKNFGELWRDTASEFDYHAPIGGKRPWLDQITLPLTMRLFSFKYRVLDDVNNFSISARVFEPESRPRLVHYHRIQYLKAWPKLWEDALEITLKQVPQDQQALFSELLVEGGF